ncbi:MAG: acyl-ACP--UDP-N-acetylglucosamine O-acyltransferase [Bacteroidales bacterium]|jgi:UDP-N-acetylglucosamine acyltransferase|nr:acyl-ACP--UDP-N-acetylglucosamine O-acyltransferase [Bacteroidales bacterium]
MNQPLAYIHPNAKIAENVVIGHFSVIEDNVTIGEGTWIGPNVTIMEGTVIGKNCKIFPGAVIAGIPQDLKFQGEKTIVKIGDNTTIREFVTINKGTIAKGKTVIGSNCLLMAYVHIAHDCVVGDNVILVNGVTLAGEVTIEDWAIISANTLIHQFCRIGAHTMFAGNSLVDKDVPPFIKVARYPISYAGINSVGLRRRGFSNEIIDNINDTYRIIFNSGMNKTDAITLLETQIYSTKEKTEIIQFVKNSKRGILKGYFDKLSENDIT